MELQRFRLQAKGYSFVYHTGYPDIHVTLMGMTDEVYETAKGNYKVLCFPSVSSEGTKKEDLESLKKDLEEDFKYDKDMRNVSASKIEESIACANVFFIGVYDKVKEYSNGNHWAIIIDKKNPHVGLIYNITIHPYMYKGYEKDGFASTSNLMGKVSLPENILDATQHIGPKQKLVKLGDIVKRLVKSESPYVLLNLFENKDGSSCMLGVSNIILNECVSSKLSDSSVDTIGEYEFPKVVYYT